MLHGHYELSCARTVQAGHSWIIALSQALRARPDLRLCFKRPLEHE